MENIQSDEALRVFIINYLSEKMGKHAILKGGMVLRLLESPRYTNDLDYIFVPFKSKKDIVDLIKSALEAVNCSVSFNLHSTSARFLVKFENKHGVFKTQIEANVDESCEAEAISTGDLALHYDQLPRIVRVMKLNVALAHKLAAWNERNLIRDLYDAYFFFKSLQILPDIKTLNTRLNHINYARSVKATGLSKSMTLANFCIKLREKLDNLTFKDVETELRDTLSPNQLPGLEKKIKVVLLELVEKLEIQ